MSLLNIDQVSESVIRIETSLNMKLNLMHFLSFQQHNTVELKKILFKLNEVSIN